MHNLSDSDSVDSDEGIRYKTESIRNKTKKNEESGTDRNKSSHRSLSSHSHYKSRQNNRSRRYSPSDSDSSRQKRNSTRKRKDPSPSRDSSENRHKSEKRKKEDTSRYKQRNSDIGKKEKFEKRDISRHDSSSKTDKKSKLTVIACEPELPKNLQKTDEQKISKPENSKQKIVYLGPALPPSFKKMIEIKTNEDESKINEINSGIENKEESVSSAENNHAIGPKLPQQIMSKKQTSEETKEVLGPALPPHLKTTEKAAQSHATSPLPNELGATDRCIGPSLPFHLRKKLAEADTTENEEINEIETYGPVPVGSNFSQAHLDLEERALQMKINQLGPNEKKEPVREEWMVQLPAAKASNLGLGPRQFRAKAGPDLSDRSSWTDTPQDKDKKKQGKEEPKVDLQREAELREIRKRDKEQEVVVKKSKRDKESLVNIHMKKMKDKKDSSASTERRPFSRELDLQVNRFDEAQKKAVLKKAQLLDTRFSSGESKFL